MFNFAQDAVGGALGYQFFFDGEGWDRAWIVTPDGNRMVDIKVKGSAGVIGLTEIFSESAEPSFEDLPRDEDFETGTVSYGFTVNSSGRATNITHIETLPPEFTDMRDRVKRNLRHIVYRPRVEAGDMVATPDIVFIHEFFYRIEDIPKKPTKLKNAKNTESTSR